MAKVNDSTWQECLDRHEGRFDEKKWGWKNIAKWLKEEKDISISNVALWKRYKKEHPEVNPGQGKEVNPKSKKVNPDEGKKSTPKGKKVNPGMELIIEENKGLKQRLSLLEGIVDLLVKKEVEPQGKLIGMATCPACGEVSKSVKSHFERRFYCRNKECTRKTFIAVAAAEAETTE